MYQFPLTTRILRLFRKVCRIFKNFILFLRLEKIIYIIIRFFKDDTPIVECSEETSNKTPDSMTKVNVEEKENESTVANRGKKS